MNGTACDTLWLEDPLPVPRQGRPEDGPDLDWWRAESQYILTEEDSIERSRRLRCPA